MKQTKKLIALASIAVMLVVVIVASTLSSAAWWPGSDKLYETVGYGNFTDGIPFGNHAYLYPAIEIDGGPNLDFEKGLEYWITGSTRYVEAVTETVDGKQNTFIRLLPEKLYNGAKTVLFPISKLKEGYTPGILYKWRGDSHAVQVTLKEVYSIVNSGGQWNSAKTEWVGHNGAQGTKSIWTADEDNESEWNIQLAINYKPVKALDSESLTDKVYYYVGVEAFYAPEISYGRIFARSGGLSDAVAQGLKEQNIDFNLNAVACDGIEECRKALLKKSKNVLDANFIEGMACVGGCIGGAGCLTHGEKNKAEVDKYGSEAFEKTISDAVAVIK